MRLLDIDDLLTRGNYVLDLVGVLTSIYRVSFLWMDFILTQRIEIIYFVCKYLVLFICTCVSLLHGTHTSNFNCLSYQLFVGVENEGNKMGSR